MEYCPEIEKQIDLYWFSKSGRRLLEQKQGEGCYLEIIGGRTREEDFEAS